MTGLRSTFRSGRVGLALAIGMAMLAAGGGATVAVAGAGGTAGAATANVGARNNNCTPPAGSCMPVLEQNLNGAGRIRVALPNGAATETTHNPWFWACCGNWVSITPVGGSGEFLGLTADACGQSCGGQGWDDFQIWVTLDGQWVLHDTWASWGSNWLQNEGNVMGGTVNQICGGSCITWHFFPPTPIAFNSSFNVYLDPCCGWNLYWVDVWYTLTSNGSSTY